MQDVLYIEDAAQAATLLQPLRLDLLKRMAEARSCVELAQQVGQTPQKVYYHVKMLEQAGLVERTGERKVRGIVEGFYRARARSYWLSPQLVGQVGGKRKAQEQLSLGFLLNLAEELQSDIGHLADRADKDIPSLGLSMQIALRDGKQRAAFMADLQQTLQTLAAKYSIGEANPPPGDGQTFRLVIACYPTEDTVSLQPISGLKKRSNFMTGNLYPDLQEKSKLMGITIQAQTLIAASPAQVFTALTKAGELTHWFAQHASVAPAEHRYAFWGHYTPETPDEQQGQRKLLVWEEGHKLAYGWTVYGGETQVTISLSEHGQGTQIIVEHTDLPKREQGQASFYDFWQLALENLRRWVECKQAPVWCDYAIHTYGDVNLSVEIDGPREAVFASLIDPAQLNRHFADAAVIELYVGGRYDFGWGEGGPIKIVELTPNKKLAYSWHYEGEQETVVTWTLDGSGGHTRLTMVHSGFGAEYLTDDYSAGWLNDLSLIKSLVEFGAGWVKPEVKVLDVARV